MRNPGGVNSILPPVAVPFDGASVPASRPWRGEAKRRRLVGSPTWNANCTITLPLGPCWPPEGGTPNGGRAAAGNLDPTAAGSAGV